MSDFLIYTYVKATDQIFTNPKHQLTEDYITGHFG
jgi:ABC-type phosphate transport system ATPase subunit